MGFIEKARKKIAKFLGQDLSSEEVSEINRILKTPKIHKIRQGTGSKVLKATGDVVRDYVVGKRKK